MIIKEQKLREQHQFVKQIQNFDAKISHSKLLKFTEDEI